MVSSRGGGVEGGEASVRAASDGCSGEAATGFGLFSVSSSSTCMVFSRGGGVEDDETSEAGALIGDDGGSSIAFS